MYDLAVTRNQFGANNTRDTETFSDQPVEDRTKVHEYNNDFDEWNTGNYTITNGGGAGTTFSAVAGDGGIIQAVTAATTGSYYSAQNVRADYSVAKNFRLFQIFLLSVDSALANIFAGLINATTTPFTGASQTDGIYLLSAGTTALSVNVAVGGVITSVANAAVLNPGLANYVTFKTYWDGGIYAAAPNGRVIWELSGAGIVTPARGSIAAPANFPGATLLTPTWGVQASTNAARTMNVDLFSIIKERVNVLATPTF